METLKSVAAFALAGCLGTTIAQGLDEPSVDKEVHFVSFSSNAQQKNAKPDH